MDSSVVREGGFMVAYESPRDRRAEIKFVGWDLKEVAKYIIDIEMGFIPSMDDMDAISGIVYSGGVARFEIPSGTIRVAYSKHEKLKSTT
ncbi:hypothetical protein AB0F25_30605 [Streptomyces wedmorensis]|uniref:hypothetical protein n=1 Tax=Streptomyces wedmorensis TaxID=43759 RepID=UPI003431BE02